MIGERIDRGIISTKKRKNPNTISTKKRKNPNTMWLQSRSKKENPNKMWLSKWVSRGLCGLPIIDG